jgi:excisionase family DNA binding protein
MENSIEPLLLSPNNAARMLDVSRSTVYNLMHTGHLSWIKVGADRRIPIDEVKRIAAESVSTITKGGGGND